MIVAPPPMTPLLAVARFLSTGHYFFRSTLVVVASLTNCVRVRFLLPPLLLLPRTRARFNNVDDEDPTDFVSVACVAAAVLVSFAAAAATALPSFALSLSLTSAALQCCCCTSWMLLRQRRRQTLACVVSLQIQSLILSFLPPFLAAAFLLAFTNATVVVDDDCCCYGIASNPHPT